MASGNYATQFIPRRGTTEEHASFIGALNEVTLDTNKKTFVVHDGVTPGGTPLPTFTDLGGKADRSELSDFRTIHESIKLDDLDTEVREILTSEYDDREIRSTIDSLQNNKLDRIEADNLYLPINYKDESIVSYDRLDTTTKDLLTSLSENTLNFESRINSIESSYITTANIELLLAGYRKDTDNITFDDLDDNIITEINKVSTIQTNIETLSENLESLQSSFETSGITDVSQLQESLIDLESKLNSGYYDYDDTTIKETITDLQTRVSTLESSGGSGEGSSSVSDATITEINARIDGLDERIDNITASGGTYDDTDIKNSISDIESDVSDLTTRVSTLESSGGSGGTYDDTDIKNSISDIEATVVDLETTVNGLSNYDDTSIKASINDVENDIASLETRVSTLESSGGGSNTGSSSGGGSTYDDTALTNRVSAIESDITLIQGDITDLESTVSGLSNYDDTVLASRVTDLETAVNGLSNYDDTEVVKNISTLQVTVETLENDVTDLKTNASISNEEKTTILEGINNITTLDTAVQRLNESNTALSTTVTGYEERIVELETNVTLLQTENTALKASVVNLKDLLDALTKKVNELHDITSVETLTDMNGVEREVEWIGEVQTDGLTPITITTLEGFPYSDSNMEDLITDFYDNDIIEVWNFGPTNYTQTWTPTFIPNDDPDTEAGQKEEDAIFGKCSINVDTYQLSTTKVTTTDYTFKIIKFKSEATA